MERVHHKSPSVYRCVGQTLTIHLHSPSKHIVQLLSMSSELSAPRHLKPSDSAYFVYSLKVYGYAYYRLVDRLVIDHKGGGSLIQRGVLYILNAGSSTYGKEFNFDSPAELESRKIWAFWVPRIGETISQELHQALDAVFDGGAPKGIQLPVRLAEGPIYISQRSVDNDGKRHGIQIATALDTEDMTVALAVGFELQFKLQDKGFKLPINNEFMDAVKDKWIQMIHFPLRVYELSVSRALDVPIFLTSPKNIDSATVLNEVNEKEIEKIYSRHESDGSVRKEIRYPLVGAVYSLGWEVLPVPNSLTVGIPSYGIITEGGTLNGEGVDN